VARVSRYVDAPVAAVFDILEDGWSYATWVVGTATIRSVDPAWPHAGSRIHHATGFWPFLLKDETESVAYQPNERLVLQARGWPAGEARIELMARPEGSGCRVTLDERIVAGPAARLNPKLADALINARNRETLRRLACVAVKP
jgi:uncharacterized protein YndB with AHSA1/START domain